MAGDLAESFRSYKTCAASFLEERMHLNSDVYLCILIEGSIASSKAAICGPGFSSAVGIPREFQHDMAVPSKRLRHKATVESDGDKNPSMLKSPNPRKLKKAKAELKAMEAQGTASASSTTASSPGILKRSPSVDKIAKKLSFGTPTVHSIEASNTKMSPERAREVLEAIKIAQGSESSEARPGACNLWGLYIYIS